MALLAPSPVPLARAPHLAPTPPSSARHAPAAGARDGAVDAVRAILLGVVVLLHALMVGIGIAPDGSPILRNAMEGWDGFAPITWIAQIMPLFFVLGGFASFTQWTRTRTRGGSTSDYIAGRMRRLLMPAAGAILATAVGLSALVLAGVPADVVATAGYRISQPLWFLGVYLGCSALVPFMMRMHERHRLSTFAALAAGVIAVDIVRGATGIAAIGLVNMAFVWLLLQQLGFALADGSLDRIRRGPLVGIAAAAVAAAAVLILTGAAPADLIAALNPPMAILVVAGIAQTALFLVLRPRLRVMAQRPRAAAVIGWVNARAMTIYAWHMLVVIALAGLALLAPIVLPMPLSAGWWISRPLWLAVVLVAVALVAARVGRREAGREAGAPSVGAGRAAGSAILGTAGVVTILVCGSLPAGWVIGAVLILLALRLAGRSVLASE